MELVSKTVITKNNNKQRTNKTYCDLWYLYVKTRLYSSLGQAHCVLWVDGAGHQPKHTESVSQAIWTPEFVALAKNKLHCCTVVGFWQILH